MMSTGRLDRRAFLKTAGLGAGALATSCLPHVAEKGKASMDTTSGRPPNILIVHVDEMRIECLGAYGNKEIRTPHVDRLAREGVLYENSFCPFPVCTPSRYSFLSGLYVHDHRGWTNRCTLSPDIETFPGILRAAGYKTKAVGKMHFTPTYLDVGFSEMELAEQDGPGRWDDDYHRYLRDLGLVDRNDLEDQRGEYRKQAPPEYWETVGALVSNLPEEHHSTTWIADRAVESIQSWRADAGYVLMAGFIKPHHPFDPPDPWHKMYDPEKLTLLPGWTDACLDRDLRFSRGYFPHEKLTEKALRRATAYYYATISQIDHHVGRMVRALKEKGLYDKTIIVFTADHGDYMGFHHLLLKGNLMYDPVVKVPLVIKWAGEGKKGRVDKRLVNNTDLAPSLCRAAGCPPGSGMPGQNLLEGGPGPEFVFAESNHGQQLMARTADRKLIVSTVRGKEMKLLFDLEKDPLEITNRYDAPEYRSDVETLEKALGQWRSGPPGKTHLDYNAPTIKAPNVPPDLSHRPAIIEYYKNKMNEERGK